MTLNHHAYRYCAEDIEDLLALLAESYLITGRCFWTPARLEGWLFGPKTRLEKEQPGFYGRNAHLWRDESGQLVGACISESGKDELYAFVHPHHRSVEPAMYRWAEEEWARSKEQLQVVVHAGDQESRALLAALGYGFKEYDGYMYRYDLSGRRLDYHLEEGFVIASAAGRPDPEQQAEVVRSAFGAARYTADDQRSKANAPSYSADLDLAIVSPEGKHAAMCMGWVDAVCKAGEIEPVATHLDFRRRGFASAIILECFRRFRAAGVQTAYISSAPEPAPSNRLYQSIGPDGREELEMWEKKLQEGP